MGKLRPHARWSLPKVPPKEARGRPALRVPGSGSAGKESCGSPSGLLPGKNRPEPLSTVLGCPLEASGGTPPSGRGRSGPDTAWGGTQTAERAAATGGGRVPLTQGHRRRGVLSTSAGTLSSAIRRPQVNRGGSAALNGGCFQARLYREPRAGRPSGSRGAGRGRVGRRRAPGPRPAPAGPRASGSGGPSEAVCLPGVSTATAPSASPPTSSGTSGTFIIKRSPSSATCATGASGSRPTSTGT